MSDDPLRLYDGERFTIGGSEFDFLAVDGNGRIAVFSHAGWGPIPRLVVDRWKQAIRQVRAAEQLPLTTRARSVPRGSGDYSFWLTKVDRGLFAYDCRNTYGPYQLIAAPEAPSDIDATPQLFRDGEGLVLLSVDFATSDTIDFSSVGIEVVEYPRHRE